MHDLYISASELKEARIVSCQQALQVFLSKPILFICFCLIDASIEHALVLMSLRLLPINASCICSYYQINHQNGNTHWPIDIIICFMVSVTHWVTLCLGLALLT